MAIHFSRDQIEDAYRYANRNLSRLRDPDRGARGVLHKLLDTGEVLLGAGAVGVAKGRFGSLKIANTPVDMDLAAGVAGHLIGFWLDSSVSEHIHNVSNGALAGWFHGLAVGAGTTLRMKAGLPPMTISGGAPGVYTNVAHGNMPGLGTHKVSGWENPPQHMTGAAPAAPLTEAELAGLAQQVR